MSFPAINPASRTWTPGSFGQSSFNAASGAEVRVLYGAVATNHGLSLAYTNITETNALAFNTHYASVQGSFHSFTLPPEVFAGMTTSFTIGTNKWRYAEPPSVDAVKPGIYNVSVSLIAVYS
jgi:hypothetical protein